MHLIATLLLGHLIADFPLQTNWLFGLKRRHWAGVLLHAAIHCAVTGFLLRDSLSQWPMLLTLGLVHVAMDWLKLRMTFEIQGPAFVVDQLAHLLALLLLSTWPSNLTGELAPGFLYSAVGYAVVPALLMFAGIASADKRRRATGSFANRQGPGPKFILLSQLAGLPLVAGTLIVRLIGA